MDYDGDGNSVENGVPEIMRLADIINSTPTPVGAPSDGYDLISLDSTYAEFREQYRNRRQVVYVGANDGMLHAFNGGFFNAEESCFATAPSVDCASTSGFPLGTELWAYVPRALLPHLQWLARQDYSHVYYMDQTVRAFDARIFANDADHPNGWGTVLVAGMRLGGGSDAGTSRGIDVDLDGDGIFDEDGDGLNDVRTRSAYVVLDITNPEQPPEVLAEISPPGLHYTTSFPQVVAMQQPSAGSPGKWYLVFGTGPSDLDTNSLGSTELPEVFAYDLSDLDPAGADPSIHSGPDPENVFELPSSINAQGTFIGDIVVSDYNINMFAEAMYFGTVDPVDTSTSTPQAPRGRLYRIGLKESADTTDWTDPQVLLNGVDQPFVSQPSITTDRLQRPWVLAGSGRLYVDNDKRTELTQTLYGFRDPYLQPGIFTEVSGTPSAVSASGLRDATGAVVRDNGTVVQDGDGFTISQYREEVEAAGGWRRDYASSSNVSAQRSTSRSTLIDGILFNTAFTPSVDLCGADGASVLIGVEFDSGIPPRQGVFGTRTCATALNCPADVLEAVGEVDLGAGLGSSPSIHIGEQDVPGKVTVIVQKSTGAIATEEATTLGGIKNGEISWRELRGLDD